MIQSRLFMPLLLMASSQMMSAINISTGQAPSDPIWTITAGGSGQAQVLTNPPIAAAWVNPPAGTAWVGVSSDAFGSPFAYSLSTTFNNASSAVLTFQALADNELRVYINNSALPVFTFIGVLAADFRTLPALQTITLGAGPTTIRLDVIDRGRPSGVLFVGDVNEAPEPSTFGAAALGVLAIGWKLRQRRSQKPL